MKPAEILGRLNAARMAVAALPADTKILSVQIDGMSAYGLKSRDYIQITTSFESLAAAGVIETGCWETEDHPIHKSVEERFWIGDFCIIHLKDIEKAATGVDGAGDGMA